MAEPVISDENVTPLLNISVPAPGIDMNGFRFGIVDSKAQSIYSAQQVSSNTVVPPAATISSVQPDALSPERQQLLKQLAPEPGKTAETSIPSFPLSQFHGSYAGNGFSLIFRPRPNNDTTVFAKEPQGPNDNILQLHLTTEQLTFGNTIGAIPNRGFQAQPDIILGGFPYLQTVQDATNDPPEGADIAEIEREGIHFETGMWLNVPESTTIPPMGPSIVRMGSIPHGTTIQAQALSPQRSQNTLLGGVTGAPKHDVLDTSPFPVGVPGMRQGENFPSMDANNQSTFRLPQDLTKFVANGSITTDIIKNPNLVLQRANQGLDIRENLSFEVSTDPPNPAINGGGTANIAFLTGPRNPATPQQVGKPNAHAASMTSKYWIMLVAYKVDVPRLETSDPVVLFPVMPPGSTAPTPKFSITPPPKLPSEAKTITVMGIQIQTSQMVTMDFGQENAVLSWPHVGVSTLVPTWAQKFAMT